MEEKKNHDTVEETNPRKRKEFSSFYKTISKRTRAPREDPVLQAVYAEISKAAEKNDRQVRITTLTQEQIDKLSEEGFSIDGPGEKQDLELFTNGQDENHVKKLDELTKAFRSKYREEGGDIGCWGFEPLSGYIVRWDASDSNKK